MFSEECRDYSEDLIHYAIARSAWHVSNDANLEADRLVRETNWASARLALLADLREDDPPPDLLLDEMVSDLVRLEPLVKDGKTKEALRDLQRAIVDWRWAIRQSPELSPAWWNGLEAVRTHEVWSKQVPEATRPGPGGPALLVPHTGYPTISPRQLRLRDVACELADRRIVLVDALDRYYQRLLIIDSEAGNIEATHTLENIPPIRHIAACGPEHILVATELDRSGRAFIVRIDLTDHTQVDLKLTESPDGLLVLAGPKVLVAVQRGAQAAYWRLDYQSMQIVGEEQQVEVLVWDSQTNEDPIERKAEVFGPGTWAQWSIGAMGGNGRYFVESGVQLFRLDESTDRIEDITTEEVRAASFGKRILGCHRLPNDALVIAVNFKDEVSSKRGTAFIKVDGNGHIEFPPLRIQYPVELLGCLCGYVLIRGGWPDSWLHSSLRLQPEAVPRTLGSRVPIVDAIGQLGLDDGRLLLRRPAVIILPTARSLSV